MNRIIPKILLSLLCVTATGFTAFPAKPEAPASDDKTQSDNNEKAEPVADQPAELAQLKETLAKRNSQISQLNQELAKEKGSVTRLNKEIESLKNVIAAAIPLAENGATGLVDLDANLATVDIDNVNQKVDALKMLSPYSDSFASQHDNLKNFGYIATVYQDNSKFDTFPYSEATNEEYADKTLEIFDLADNFLSKAQVDSINNLYRKIFRYRDAVEAFDKLISNLDDVLEINRDNKAADNLCIADRNAVLDADESKALTAQINSYRYLAGLYDRFIGELEKSPRSRTEEIRNEINAMLADTEDNDDAADVSSDTANNNTDNPTPDSGDTEGEENDDTEDNESEDTPDAAQSQDM